jgi:hypothetical protein
MSAGSRRYEKMARTRLDSILQYAVFPKRRYSIAPATDYLPAELQSLCKSLGDKFVLRMLSKGIREPSAIVTAYKLMHRGDARA